jgi:hypothetical protein
MASPVLSVAHRVITRPIRDRSVTIARPGPRATACRPSTWAEHSRSGTPREWTVSRWAAGQRPRDRAPDRIADVRRLAADDHHPGRPVLRVGETTPSSPSHTAASSWMEPSRVDRCGRRLGQAEARPAVTATLDCNHSFCRTEHLDTATLVARRRSEGHPCRPTLGAATRPKVRATRRTGLCAGQALHPRPPSERSSAFAAGRTAPSGWTQRGWVGGQVLSVWRLRASVQPRTAKMTKVMAYPATPGS